MTADRTYVITGAGSGLGLATARHLAGQGANVVLLDLDGQKLSLAEKEIGTRAATFEADVTSESQVRHAIAAAVKRFGSIDGLVNCAGVAPGEKIIGRSGPHDLERFTRTLMINLVGSFNLLRLCAEAMVENTPGPEGQRGVIINTASIAAYDGQIGQAAYAASKGGVAALTLPAARELAQHGIRVVTIAPGIFETPMMAGMSQEVQDALGASVPFPKRLGKPEEYAMLVSHIIENPMLNGEVIRLDGALRMAPR